MIRPAHFLSRSYTLRAQMRPRSYLPAKIGRETSLSKPRTKCVSRPKHGNQSQERFATADEGAERLSNKAASCSANATTHCESCGWLPPLVLRPTPSIHGWNFYPAFPGPHGQMSDGANEQP